MANTTNLNLEEIELNDTIRDGFVTKINSNQSKIDNAYGVLVDNLMEHTEASNLEEAIENLQDINTLQDEINRLNGIGNATASQILKGKTALVQGETITGTALSTTTTATTSNVASGKTYYDNTGTLRTGTYIENTPEFKSVDVTGYVNTLTIPFTKTHNRVIVYACPTQTTLGTLVRNADLCLVCADTGLVSTSSTASLGCTFVSNSIASATGYVYVTRYNSVSGAWNGTNYTITTSGNYYIGRYNNQTITYYAIGL